jgi:hypothetical protein
MTHSILKLANGRRRHQLLPTDLLMAQCDSINSVRALRQHLQTAVELEHSTIPPYLCALYSINPERNEFAYRTIQGVVMEEMLHMILAANILNAIGGEPSINSPQFIPEYPTYLPHSNNAFLVSLQKFSPDCMDVFLKIEHPAPQSAPPEAHHYATIGQFYSAIKRALCRLDQVTPGGIFTGDYSRQVRPEHYYGGGGKLVAIRHLDDAILAINEIIGQGEGIDGSIVDTDHELFGEQIEYAHYFKYMEIFHQRRYQPTDSAQLPPSGAPVAVDWNAVADMQTNPKMSDYKKGSELWQKTYEFNYCYMQLLKQLHLACNGEPEVIMQAVPVMYELKYKAIELMQMPTASGKRAGPSFEYVVI